MEVIDILERWRSSLKPDVANLKVHLESLAQNECWVVYFQMFEAAIPQLDRESIKEISAIALRHLVVDLEDVERAKQFLCSVVTRFQLKFDELEHVVVKKIIEQDDIHREADLLEATISSLPDAKEREIGLERLCMLFDKRLPREKKLKKAIYELLDCNSKNVTGLRFLKNSLVQNQDWVELETVLVQLLEILTHPEEKLRAALDLAALYLYQLGDADNCLAVLKKFGNDRIDTSKMRYRAYEFLGKWNECLAILEQSYLKAFDDEEKSAILLLKGKIYFHRDQIKEAYVSYIKSAKLTRLSLAPAEEALKLAIRLRDIGEVSNILSYLLDKEDWSPECIARAKFLLDRLQQFKKKDHE